MSPQNPEDEAVTLNDILPTTPDLRAERLAELKRLFPDLFTNEGRLNPDELKQLVEPNEVHESERYEFKWYGKAASKREAFTPTTAALVYDQSRSVNPDQADGNMIIEGENLETLKLLLNAYREQVKCIYIDPPYNTGNDFIYRDNYRKDKAQYWEETGSAENGIQLDSNPETSGRYHSDWLCFIHERLLVARQMLCSEGIVLISIDDHEMVNLRRVADEVFGEENHVATLLWEKGRKNDSKLVSIGHEYIICYAKDKLRLNEIGTKWREAKPGASGIHEVYLRLREKHGDDYRAIEDDLRLFYESLPNDHPSRRLTRYKRVDSQGVWRDDNMSWPGGNGPSYDVLHPVTGKPCAVPPGGWRYSTLEKMNAAIAAGRVEFRQDHTEPPIRKTYLLRDDSNENDTDDDSESDAGIQVAGTYFYRSALPASRELESLFGAKVFNNPKDHEVLSRWIGYVSAGDTTPLILDFFAGSGSTAHACLDLLCSGFATRWILVQIPEVVDAATAPGSNALEMDLKTVSDITIERVKRVIQGYGDNPQPMPETGFKVYRLQKSNFPRCAFKPDPSASEADNVAALRRYIDEKEGAFFLSLDERGERAVFDEVLLKNGFQLHYTRERREDFADNTVFEIRDPRRRALVCLAWNENIADATIKRLRELSDTGERPFFICLERSLSTTSKWNLKHFLGDHFNAF